MMPILPRVLLAEDDPVSRVFLESALQALPVRVDTADCLATAIELATSHRYDLWLLDAHLPDGSGAQLLASLRQRAADTPAWAHTATNDPTVRQKLLEAGFGEVLVKPLTVAALQAAVRSALGTPGESASDDQATDMLPPDWDDEAASRALNGNRQHIAALRELFIGELPTVRNAVVEAYVAHDTAAMRAHLHRLQASCGFVGAARLGAATQALHEHPDASECMREFESAAGAVLALAEADAAAERARG